MEPVQIIIPYKWSDSYDNCGQSNETKRESKEIVFVMVFTTWIEVNYPYKNEYLDDIGDDWKGPRENVPAWGQTWVFPSATKGGRFQSVPLPCSGYRDFT